MWGFFCVYFQFQVAEQTWQQSTKKALCSQSVSKVQFLRIVFQGDTCYINVLKQSCFTEQFDSLDSLCEDLKGGNGTLKH